MSPTDSQSDNHTPLEQSNPLDVRSNPLDTFVETFPHGQKVAQTAETPATPHTAGIAPVRCGAKSKRTGHQCGRFVLPGHLTCKWHGGSSPQALAKAKERLQHLIPHADTALGELITQRDHLPSRLGAVRELYDRVEGSVKTGTAVAVGVSINIPRWAVDGSSLPAIDVESSESETD